MARPRKVQPSVPTPPIAGTPIDLIAPETARALTLDEIREFAESGDMKKMQVAREQLMLRELIEKEQVKQNDRDQRLRMSYQTAKSAQEAEASEKRFQQLCAATYHKRPDGQFAINGQRTYDGVTQYTCSRCHSTFVGAGREPGQLPLEIANNLGPDAVGGVGVMI